MSRWRAPTDKPLGDLASVRHAVYLRARVREVRRELAKGNRTRGSGLALLGFVSGFAAGVLLWSRQQHTFKRGLFSRSPLRRLAALGYLSGRPTLETVRLLRDYVRWEPRAALRRRGERVLRRVELDLK
jgi:hypothetical protein